jgi:hypothetical protein
MTTSPGVQVDPPRRPYERRWVGGEVYTQVDSDRTAVAIYQLPSGKSWVAIDLDRVARSSALCNDLLFGSSQSGFMGNSAFRSARPDSVLDVLRDAGARLARVDSQVVRGVETTHWRIIATDTTTTSVAPRCASPIHREDAVEIWIDAQDRLRRIADTVTVTSTAPVLGGSSSQAPSTRPAEETLVSGTTTTEFFDFGADVHVSSPPRDQVYDLTEQLLSGHP